MTRFGFAIAAVALLVGSAPAPSQDQAMAERLRNDPRVEALVPYGQRIPPEMRSDKTVQFGKALRFLLSGQLEFGRVGAITPLVKPVAKGDRIVVAFWARAEKTENGAPGRIGRVQLETTPKVRALFAKPFDVTPEWKMYQLAGVADADYAPGTLNVALHLDAAKQILEIGPVFVLDYGKKPE